MVDLSEVTPGYLRFALAARDPSNPSPMYVNGKLSDRVIAIYEESLERKRLRESKVQEKDKEN